MDSHPNHLVLDLLVDGERRVERMDQKNSTRKEISQDKGVIYLWKY